jgi:hypothetical protein
VLINYYSYESVDYVKGKTKRKDENGEEGELSERGRCDETNILRYILMMLINIMMTKKGTRRGKRCNIHYFRIDIRKGHKVTLLY